MFLFLLLLLAIIILIPLGWFLFKRAREKKAFKGAVFWLTSFWLCLVFVLIGLGWGLVSGVFKDFKKNYEFVESLE